MPQKTIKSKKFTHTKKDSENSKTLQTKKTISYYQGIECDRRGYGRSGGRAHGTEKEAN